MEIKVDIQICIEIEIVTVKSKMKLISGKRDLVLSKKPQIIN